jgi:hypothetical protein
VQRGKRLSTGEVRASKDQPIIHERAWHTTGFRDPLFGPAFFPRDILYVDGCRVRAESFIWKAII